MSLKVETQRDFARLCAKNLTAKATPEQRNQIMGHDNSSVFLRNYISARVGVNTQAISLGVEPRRNRAEMSLGQDLRYPKELSEEEKKECEKSEAVQQAREELDKIDASLIRDFGSIGKAPEEMQKKRNTVRSRMHSRRFATRQRKLTAKREEFFRTSSDRDIHAQLNGIKIETPKMPPREVPENVSYLLADKNGNHDSRQKLLEVLGSRLQGSRKTT